MQCGLRLVDDPAVPLGDADRPDPDRTDVVIPVVAPAPEDDAEVQLVPCPRCGSSNAARRGWCGRCGERLHDDAVPSSWREPAEAAWVPDDVDQPADEAVTPPARRRRRRGLAVAVVLLGLAFGTVLGLAAGLGLGPFATVEPVAFDPQAYPRESRVQRPATASSSSTAATDGARTFGPAHTADGDLTTAWVPDGEERGALLVHGFVAPVWVDRIEVATGDQSDEATFAATARVTSATVDLGTVKLDVTIGGIDGVQVVRLPEPVLTDEVVWEVTGTSGGVGAISEIRYVGWAADEADQQAYRQR